MNKQIGYITSAHLLLFSIAAGYFFIAKISSASNNQEQGNLIDRVTTAKETVLSPNAAKGKTLFMSRCASCHHLFKTIQGPPLDNVLERGPWKDRNQLYEWIRNPEGFMKKNEYVPELKKTYTITMGASPSLTDEEIDWIFTYIKEAGTPVAVP